MFHTTFYVRRLHSLCGLLVLGMVLFEHIFTNSMAILGPEGLNTALEMMELIPKPIFMGLEIGGIAVPLLFHGIYGIYIALHASEKQSLQLWLRSQLEFRSATLDGLVPRRLPYLARRLSAFLRQRHYGYAHFL